MAKAIIMPKFGFTQEESTIVAWLKNEGDVVEKGDPIAEVTTDKIDMEVEAPADGILGGIRRQAGETVPVTEVIAYILAEGEEPPPPEEAPAGAPVADSSPSAAALAPPAAGADATPVARRVAEAEGVDLAAVEGSGPGGKITREDVEAYAAGRELAPPDEGNGRVRATPAARRVARERGIDLAAVEGTGPRGRVQEADALAAVERAAPPVAPTPAPAAPAPPVGEVEVIPLEGMRKTIADRMQHSYQHAPHITLTRDVDMTNAIAFRAYANDHLPEGAPRISMTALIVKAAAWALREYPIMNAHLMDDAIHLMPRVNVGVAVALDGGLIVPVVHDADRRGLREVGAAVADLAARAREARLRPGDVEGGTFTVSNLGMLGIDHFTAILNPPEVGILAVGRTTQRFVPGERGEPVAKPIMIVTLAVDHRAVDGALGARFLAALCDAIEEPASIIL
jgi:pyruvate dehydrogenase E2 component (dihydrolipoamide acetyltransferase)